MRKEVLAVICLSGFAAAFAGAQSLTEPAVVSPAPARSVRLSFVPPPMEGTISLGIYDENGQLVRVLHQEAELDEFTVGADALITRWDGKDNDGYDLPAGEYSARGFVVGTIKIEEIGLTESPMFIDPPDSIRVKLIANPLENNDRPTLSLSAAFDDENAYLKTTDGLPLVTIAKTGEIMATDVALMQNADKSLEVYLKVGGTTHKFRLRGIAKMMAFDCGEFELK